MKKIISILLITLLTSCWNYNEINDLALTTAIAIDKEKNNFKVSILISNPKKEETPSNNSSKTVIYSGKGNTISKALNEIDLISSKKIYIEHLTVLVISEEVAKNDISDVLDFFLRTTNSSKKFEIIISKSTKALDIIKTINPLESFPSQGIKNSINISSITNSMSKSVTYNDFIYDLLIKGKNPTLPSIKLIKKEKKHLKLDSLAVFKNNKLIAFLSNNDSKGVNIINNDISEINLYLKCGKNYSTIKITNLNSKKSLINKLNFKISVKGEGRIIEDNCNHNLNNSKVIKKIEMLVNKKIKKITNNSIKSLKKLKSDVFGFGNILSKFNPSFYKKFNDWHNTGFIFSNIKISTNIKIISNGETKKIIKEDNNEKY